MPSLSLSLRKQGGPQGKELRAAFSESQRGTKVLCPTALEKINPANNQSEQKSAEELGIQMKPQFWPIP